MSYTRKEFLQNSALLAGAALLGSSFTMLKNKPLLSFSTIGCPDWTLKQAIDAAVRHGYTALELRGINRELDLTKTPEFSSPENIKSTLALMKEKGLRFINLGASTALHMPEGPVRDKHIKEAKSFIDLAQQINCPYVRVFPNDFPKDQDRNKTIEYVSSGLLELGRYAKERKVTVLLETHGAFSYADDILTTMKAAKHPNIGLIWDIANMWTKTKEAPSVVYNKLKEYIHHTHIKDAKLLPNGKVEYVFIGKGDVPILEAIEILARDGYKGYYSFEWEKLWHPELAEPELALADYSKVMKEHFKL
jgi:sugar phosphate isomerase/epimerase